MTTETAIQRAVRLAGGQRRLAIALGIKQPSVAEWLKRGKVPATRAASVSAITGISCKELRPDVFGEPSKKRAA
ncbi:hypothetical protein CH75_06320 [Dyella jiangningensis]|nr:hypothetical protein CH75_06320 [Dyella jiangningensis]